ncbi:MAG: fused MFS/spermidine synthase [bacterium]|nr:fused MFS/spermidine synthase [bacterium]
MIQTILIILLLEGFITISIEILTMRQLLPFFGGSVVITSVIIGIFLLFLALGYWRGGCYHRDFFKQLNRNFVLSLLWVGMGLSYSFTSLYFYTSTITLSIPFLLSLMGYLLFVLSPIVYWLGQTIPLTTNLFNQEHKISRISGTALFVSTIGSFLGAIVTSLILFQYLGVAWTIVFNCMVLFVIIMLIRTQSKLSWPHIFYLVLVLLFISFLNLNPEREQFKKTNNYANYQIISLNGNSKILEINKSHSSLITLNKKGFPYIEFIKDLLFNKLRLQHKKLLIIGAGGFSLSAQGTHDNEVTYIDIDPEIKKIAESQFLQEPIKGTFFGQDARRFLNQHQTLFDVVVSDVYTHQTTMPPALLTVEYFQSINSHLKPSGLALFNIIANSSFGDEYSQIVANTIHVAFPYCEIIPLNEKGPFSNIIYICHKTAENKKIYSDNLNTSTLDYFNSSQQFKSKDLISQ